MTSRIDAPQNGADDVVRSIYNGFDADEHEVLVDDVSRQLKAALSAPLTAVYPQLSAERDHPDTVQV
jgi:hypothetical protein